jgi:hypothetical protein
MTITAVNLTVDARIVDRFNNPQKLVSYFARDVIA